MVADLLDQREYWIVPSAHIPVPLRPGACIEVDRGVDPWIVHLEADCPAWVPALAVIEGD